MDELEGANVNNAQLEEHLKKIAWNRLLCRQTSLQSF
jgi:hypothetical protein